MEVESEATRRPSPGALHDFEVALALLARLRSSLEALTLIKRKPQVVERLRPISLALSLSPGPRS